jgi:hypothetical protein
MEADVVVVNYDLATRFDMRIDFLAEVDAIRSVIGTETDQSPRHCVDPAQVFVTLTGIAISQCRSLAEELRRLILITVIGSHIRAP